MSEYFTVLPWMPYDLIGQRPFVPPKTQSGRLGEGNNTTKQESFWANLAGEQWCAFRATDASSAGHMFESRRRLQTFLSELPPPDGQLGVHMTRGFRARAADGDMARKLQ
jgi:hypothetical protein